MRPCVAPLRCQKWARMESQLGQHHHPRRRCQRRARTGTCGCFRHTTRSRTRPTSIGWHMWAMRYGMPISTLTRAAPSLISSTGLIITTDRAATLGVRGRGFSMVVSILKLRVCTRGVRHHWMVLAYSWAGNWCSPTTSSTRRRRATVASWSLMAIGITTLLSTFTPPPTNLRSKSSTVAPTPTRTRRFSIVGWQAPIPPRRRPLHGPFAPSPRSILCIPLRGCRD
mmetsp:Transcript_21521/g.34465  ORF Transcript_21521/g.34465 Transcript_21521/m.34465 type:complete len:226 (+) Transcript_21521:651-1328(+)